MRSTDANVSMQASSRGGSVLDLTIVGGGPSGLAAAIAAEKAGLRYLLVEKGTLVNSIYRFPSSMVFFTSPDLLEIGDLPFTTPYQKPTRAEALRYYRRAADAYSLQVALDREVLAIRRIDGDDGYFEVESKSGQGGLEAFRSRTVILATGYYDHPNLLGIPGEDLPHVSHYFTDPHPYFRKSVVVVGGNNSAAESALEIWRAGGKVTLIHRGEEPGRAIKYWVRPDLLNRIEEGSIAARFKTRVIAILRGSVQVESDGRGDEIDADSVLLMTGYHPDADLLRRAGVTVEENTLVPECDPETLETRVPGLYLAGAIVAGRETNRIFIENGRNHGDQIIPHIASRLSR